MKGIGKVAVGITSSWPNGPDERTSVGGPVVAGPGQNGPFERMNRRGAVAEGLARKRLAGDWGVSAPAECPIATGRQRVAIYSKRIVLMAMESACKLQVGRDHYDGKVRMEADYIDFAGQTKFRFRISEMTAPKRQDLTIQFGFHGHAVTIELTTERAVQNWIDYIQNPRTLADKLGVKDGHTIRLMNLDDSELLVSLQTKNTKLVSHTTSRCDMVMLGVERSSELRQLEDLSENLRPNGAIWVVLPKSGRTVTKANVVAAVREAGLNHVEVVDYSETQAAHKIVRNNIARNKRSGNGSYHTAAAAAEPPVARRASLKTK